MKRLLIILFCLPLLFACQKDELFEEGQEIVLNFSVDLGDMQSVTRAFADDANRSRDLWLVVFNSEGYFEECVKATITGTSEEGVTSFTATLHATLQGRIMHLLLNYDDDNNSNTDLEFSYGHENNLIGGLTVERDRDVYWQRVELPEGITGKATVEKYLTKVPLVRNFSKITVSVACDHFNLLGFYVLNVPNRGTVAPFSNGEFVEYYDQEGATFNGNTAFTSKDYATLNGGGYHGTMPDNDERIQTATAAAALTSLSDTIPYYLYESTYVKGSKDKTVSVLLQGEYTNNDNVTNTYWYRVDLVKPNATTGVIEYLDVLRNFAYNINITHVTAGKASASDAITQPAGNNILSSLDIAHLTNVSDGKASLEVNYTDTVLITNAAVKVKYKFTDVGKFTDENGKEVAAYTNEDIQNKTAGKCGYYVTYGGNVYSDNVSTLPISVDIADGDITNGDGWRDVTITVKDKITGGKKEVSVTFFALSTTGTVLSRTVHYTLLPQQTMLVECPSQVEAEVGKEVRVDILIPDGLPEAMFPLDFAIEAQAYGNDSYLAQYLTPANTATVSVKTGNSIVPGFTDKKSFHYIVSLTYEQYKYELATDDRTVGDKVLTMRVLPTLFKTNTAQSASTVYAYNGYFILASDYFLNDHFMATFSDDNTEVYGVGRPVTLNITAGVDGTYTISSTTADAATTSNVVTRAISDLSYTLAAGETKSVNLTTSTFAEQVYVNVTCDGVSKRVTAAVRNKLNPKVESATYNGSSVTYSGDLGIYSNQNDAKNRENAVGTTTITDLKAGNNSYTIAGLSELTTIYFSYKTGNYIYTASATANALNAGTAVLAFTREEIRPTLSYISWSDADYYGEGKTVTLSFQTDMPDLTYSISSSNLNLSRTSVSGNTVTMTFTTTTWSDPASVMITAEDSDVQQITGPTRNKLNFKLTGSGDNLKNSTDVTMSVANANVEDTWRNWRNGKTVTVNGLEKGTTIQFSYTSSRTTYVAETTAGALADGSENINFE